MWEIDPGPETVTLTKAQVYEAVEKAYKDLLKCRRAGHMRLSHAVYPDVRKILKHMGFGEKS
jgi:virulence-associated protein VapD